MFDVDEYVAGNILFVYGFSGKIVIGESYGPSLWFDCATLNVIDGEVFVVSSSSPVVWIDPSTVSPISNTPFDIDISINLGTQYFVTSTPSKNAYILVKGFILLETNWMFLDLILATSSLLTTLSPVEVLSNSSVTTVLMPFLDSTPFSTVVLTSSSIVEVVVLSIFCLPLQKLFLDSSDLFLVPLVTSVTPVQLVDQAFHTIGANPVCGSTFRFFVASAKVSA